MRKIGSIGKAEHARLFSDYLYARGIANTVEPDDAAGWLVWGHDEDKVEPARAELERFLASPADPAYAAAAREADARRRQEQGADAAYRKRFRTRADLFRASWFRSTPATGALVVLSIAATLFGGLGADTALTRMLSITAYHAADGYLDYDVSLPEILRGQVWRLVTPIFLHATPLGGYGLLHIVFNMLWLTDLGGMIERAQKGRKLLLKVVVIGAVSNIFQFLAGGPAFGGMSGVVYGLLGYAWLRGKMDLTSGLYVHSQTMIMMTFWFLLCLSGRMGPVANAAHASGLVVGVLWGYLSVCRANRLGFSG